MMKLNQMVALAGSVLLVATSCKKGQPDMTVANAETGNTTEKIYIDPVPGGSGSMAPSTETTVSYIGTDFNNTSRNLGGALSGVQMLVSNQPEQVSSRGWVFRGSINDGNLGSLRGISGNFVFYLYHYLFGTVGANTKAYLVARNVTAGSVTVTGRGYYEVKQSNSDLSTSLRTARHWVNDKRSGTTQPGITGPTGTNIQRLRTVNQTIPANSFAILDEVAAPNSQTLDGRYELNASSSIVVYYVYDNLDALSASAKLTQLATIVGSNTSRARGTWIDPAPSTNGYIIETGFPAPNVPSGLTVPTANGRFGRECGIYNNSDWSGITNVSLPTGIATLRLHYNTSTKSGGQEQCADASTVGAFRATTPVDSTAFQGSDYNIFKANGGRPTNALRSYGNYGHYYQLTFNVSNTTGRTRRVQLLVGRPGGGRYYAPFWVRSAGFVTGNVDAVTDIILDPGVPGGNVTEKVLADVTIGNGAPGANIRINAVVPGSINIGQYFLIRTLD
jgi:hypothetical protein